MNKCTKYKTSHEGVGTFVSVWLDEDNGLVKRTFDGDHCGEGVSKRTSKADILFKNEIYWLTHPELSGSKFLPELIDIDEEAKTIVQKYYGPNLLDYLHDPKGFPKANAKEIKAFHTWFTKIDPDLVEKLVKMKSSFVPRNKRYNGLVVMDRTARLYHSLQKKKNLS